MLTSAVFVLVVMAVGLSVRPAPHGRMASTRVTVGLVPIAVTLVLATAWMARSPVLPVAILQLSTLGVFLVRATRRRRAQHELAGQVVMFVEDVSQQLQSGGVLVSAFLRTLTDYPIVEAQLGSVVAATRTGVRLEEALDQASEQQESDGLRLLATSVAVLTSSGGPAATSLERLAQTLRDTASARDEAWAQASQALASAVMLAALPLVFACGYALLEPDVVAFYFRTGLGGVCLVVMLGLISVGAVWVELVIGRVR